MPRLLSLPEAARLLGVDSAEVIRMIYRKELERVIEDGRIKIPVDQPSHKKLTEP